DAGSDAMVDDGASFPVTTATVSDDASSFFWTTSGTGTFDESGKDTIYDLIDPTYTPSGDDFANGGVQLTLTATPTGSCTTPVTDYMFLRVEDHPPVDFTWASSCKGTDTEFFIDTDETDVSTIASYVWDFGDGKFSTEQNPLHTFETADTYVVTLTVTNTEGYTSIVWHYVEVNELPYANFSVDGSSCDNLTTQFTDHSAYPSGYIVEWHWDFDDGTETTIEFGDDQDLNVTHTFANSGSYYVSLTVKSSDSCVNAASQTVVVKATPIADFSYTDACFGEITSFTDESIDVDNIDIVSWEWDFGDPTTGVNNSSTEQNAVHQFFNMDTYDVSLTVTNSQGCSNTVIKTVVIDEPPDVEFTHDTSCINSPIQFTVDQVITDLTTVSTWFWDFGDGITSTEQNPLHTYLVDETYTVTLRVTDLNGCTNSVSHELILAPLPISLFGASESQCLSDAIEFTNYSTSASGYIVECIWDFGDGYTSTTGFLDKPSHIYNASGTYFATLTVTNSNGCSNISTREITIQPGPIASFDFESACLDVSTNFTNSSQPNDGGTIISWDWNFDDLTSGVDNTSTLQNPSHVFSTVGEHLVQLTVTNESGCSSTDARTITVAVLSDIDFEAVGGTCLDKAVEFFIDQNLLNLSSIQSALWDFGDGSSSNDTQPAYTYQNAGTYTITLTIVDINGCTNSVSKDVYIDQLPNVNFDTDAPSCEGNKTFFNDLSSTSNFIKEWYWEFGDGTDTIIDWPDDQNISHIYESSGSYFAKLTITTDAGCRNTFEKQISIITGPVAYFVATTVCINHPAGFTDLSQENSGGVIVDWYWDFGDPISGINNTSSSQNPVHLYAVSETYPVSLTVINAEGCQSTYSDDIVVTIPPVIEPFTFSSPICVNSIAEFQMSNDVNISDVQTIHWDFGDPNAVENSSSDQNPTHIYVTPGEYIIALTLDNYKCGGSVSDTINVLPVPQAQLEFDNACKDSPTQFTDLSFNTGSDIESWRWDFGVINLVSDTSTLQNPVYSYPESGLHYVQLMVTDVAGCIDTSDATPIEIFPVPNAQFTFETNVEGIQGNIKFINESVDATEYLWDFGDGGISTEVDPTHPYDASIITYELDLVLIGYNDYGCSDTATLPYSLYFKGLFIPTAFSPSDYQTSMVRIFKPVGVNLEVFKVEVYDYWGNLIWKTNALDDEGRPTEFWDGTFNGSKLPAGVYVWAASGIFKDGTVWEGKEMGSNEGGNGQTYGTVLLIQ
ncbi:MAG: PKD domain-containing protein, partial [Bacteroidetes bacterium]|nr:PKD domain-containing protein [Bacteroidota bacterium]